MTQSSEYPDLLWMPPKSWDNTNRTSVQLIVIHTTEGSEHGQSAEDGAAYDQRRTDGTSTHFFHDSNSTVQCVHTADQAHAARTQGNKRGIQHELCADAADTWNDDYHQAVLRQAARQCARDAKKWGIPIKKLNPDQVAAGTKGFCGHADVTYAFPQDNGTHTDPGKNFPWSQFLAMVTEEAEEPMSYETFKDNAKKLCADPEFWPYLNTLMAEGPLSAPNFIFTYQDGKSPHGTAKWKEQIGGADGTVTGETFKRVAQLETKVDELAADLAEIKRLLGGGTFHTNG